MTFRTRVSLALAATALVPLVLFGLGLRREMTARLERQADRRVVALVDALRRDLAADGAATGRRLRALAQELAEDNRFRLATVGGGDRRWLLDWAGEAMRLSGLALLEVEDADGRILSSGHFRNDYDRVDSVLGRGLLAAAGPALARARTAQGAVQVLASADTFLVAGRRFLIAGGTGFDSLRLAGLARDEEIGVRLVTDTLRVGAAVAEIVLPFIDVAGGHAGTGRLVVTRDPAPLRALRRSVDRWFLAALALSVALVLALGFALADRVSRPLADLARKTAALDLDRLDQRFATDREDEVGALSRLLDAMTGRLRAGAARLREAERRATVGDLARQVNHDIKNGLAPIRHVVRHLAETAERDPERLGAIFAERRGTLESSIEYLDGLARNYARLSPALDRTVSDANPVLREIARQVAGDAVIVETRLAEPTAPVRADPLVLRRILENLARNAVDALGGTGRVSLGSARAGTDAAPLVRLTVADTGRGMSREELDRAFDDFYTTKPAGTGLGLSVVRRLVADLGGTLRVETAPGQGTTFTVEIPAA